MLFCWAAASIFGDNLSMKSWKERWYVFTSFVLCALAVILGVLLYPLVLTFFSVVALVYAGLRKQKA